MAPLNGRKRRRIVELSRLGHRPETIASLLELSLDVTSRCTAEARERARTGPLRAITTDGRPRFRAGQLAYRPTAVKRSP
jgi:hypothetical protein